MKKEKLHGGSKQQTLTIPSASNVASDLQQKSSQLVGTVGNVASNASKRVDDAISKLAETPKMGPIKKQVVKQQQEDPKKLELLETLLKTRQILESLLIP